MDGEIQESNHLETDGEDKGRIKYNDSVAWDMAYAEKPLQDIAAKENITDSEKAVLIEQAEKNSAEVLSKYELAEHLIRDGIRSLDPSTETVPEAPSERETAPSYIPGLTQEELGLFRQYERDYGDTTDESHFYYEISDTDIDLSDLIYPGGAIKIEAFSTYSPRLGNGLMGRDTKTFYLPLAYYKGDTDRLKSGTRLMSLGLLDNIGIGSGDRTPRSLYIEGQRKHSRMMYDNLYYFSELEVKALDNRWGFCETNPWKLLLNGENALDDLREDDRDAIKTNLNNLATIAKVRAKKMRAILESENSLEGRAKQNKIRQFLKTIL